MKAPFRPSPAGARRRPRVGPVSRLVALTLALLGASSAPAAADPGVLMHFTSGSDRFDRFFDTTALKNLQDVTSESYVLRDPSGSSSFPYSGVSVRRLITAVNRSPDTVGYVRLNRARGTWTTLTAQDLADPAPFVDGRKPLVFVDSLGTRYIRPVRNDQDVNATDDTSSPSSDQPLEIWVSTGRLFQILASADPTSPAAGDPVAFTAKTPDAPAGQAVAVRWDFGDGTSGQGTSVTHSYAQRGTYDALATASTPDDSGGASDLVQISVGDPPSKPGSTTPAGTQPQGGPTGPSKGPASGDGGGPGGGGEGTAKDSSAIGGSAGGSTTTPRRTPGSRDQARAPTSTTPPTSAPAATATPPTTTSPTPTPPRPAPRARSRTRRRAGVAALATPLVRGVLVDAPIPLAAVRAPSAADAGRQAAARAGRLPHPVPLGAVAVATLMGLGAWRETVRRRRRLALLG